MKATKGRLNYKKILAIALAALLLHLTVVMPVATVIIYEAIFSTRFETEDWLCYSTEDFEGLSVERSDFYSSDGVRLAGYKYSRAESGTPQGVAVVAHGLGGGGHNFYMPLINELCKGGYAVFAYDAHGNDESEGDSAEGLPQGVIDLDCAISHVKALECYDGLPIVLLGHSWGAYSAASVLSLHPDVKAAVLLSGFNESEDLLLHEARRYAWIFADLSSPYVFLYERIKFGSRYADASAIDGIADSNADVLVVHSEDDADVPFDLGYGKLYGEYGDSERVEFIKYTDRGHNYVFCSEDSQSYRDRLNAEYTEYVEARGGEYNAEIKREFMSQYLDKSACFEPDPDLVTAILELYNTACEGNK